MNLISINHESRLYNVTAGKGYTSCIGFDFAEGKRRAVLEWLGQWESEPGVQIGTPEAFAAYESAMARGAAFTSKTGHRCPADLIPELIGKERLRVEVTAPDGTKRRFYVGRSSGWFPCHLEIKLANSTGGQPVDFPPGSTVRTVTTPRRYPSLR